jgi:hypothetical protein
MYLRALCIAMPSRNIETRSRRTKSYTVSFHELNYCSHIDLIRFQVHGHMKSKTLNIYSINSLFKAVLLAVRSQTVSMWDY